MLYYIIDLIMDLIFCLNWKSSIDLILIVGYKPKSDNSLSYAVIILF